MVNCAIHLLHEPSFLVIQNLKVSLNLHVAHHLSVMILVNLHIITKMSEANGERRVWIGQKVDVNRVFAICISVLFLSLLGKYFISTKIDDSL